MLPVSIQPAPEVRPHSNTPAFLVSCMPDAVQSDGAEEEQEADEHDWEAAGGHEDPSADFLITLDDDGRGALSYGYLAQHSMT